MHIDEIKKAVLDIVNDYPITRVILFGSQASGMYTDASDIDLIVEFNQPITLITIAKITQQLETVLNKKVDVIHGPIQSDDLLDIDKEIEIYAA